MEEYGRAGMNLTLTRDLMRADCTLGRIQVGETFYETMELPWLNNQQGISCVPQGDYQLFRHNSEAHPRTWALVNPKLNVIHYPQDGASGCRSLILIHIANYAAELRGCIGVGMARVFIGHTWMVQQSARAMAAIQAALPWTDDHTLTIRSLT